MNTIKFLNLVKKYKNRTANWYKQHATLRLSSEDIDLLFKEDIRSREAELRRRLSEKAINYDELPPEVQLAIFDMAYNLRVDGLLQKFPRILTAVKDRNYWKAANECNRLGIPARRNQMTKKLLRQAALLKSIRGGPYSAVH
ncbi:MAG TPA: hypothetical protein GX391_01045 [Firmicutes bacterium]|jgi:hypothetical protein|nr:hypothetical protein [Bacillota bacterium]HOQ24198.1 hypothetical protein [Bacillota bacterium]HPT67642.1 hypothetical protein [Bacillota bacterium]